jgi:hypothetical protein
MTDETTNDGNDGSEPSQEMQIPRRGVGRPRVTHREPFVSHRNPAPLSTREESVEMAKTQPMADIPRPGLLISHDGTCPHCKSVLRHRLILTKAEPGKPNCVREHRNCRACLRPFVQIIEKLPPPTQQQR